MKFKNKNKKTGILIIYSIFRILLEIFIAMFILGIFIPLFLIPTLLSIIFVIYYFYKEVISNNGINEINGKRRFIYIFNVVYSIFVLILGCILFTEGGFARYNAIFFFIISALFIILEILKYFYIEKKEMPSKNRMKMIAYSILCSAIIFSMSIVGSNLIYLNNQSPLRYTQEDIDNADIAYVDIKINSTIQTNETHMYKTWHTGGDYLTLIYKIEPWSNISCYVVHDQNLMAGGSVSISGEGIDAEITTYKMKNEEGWFYFYIYRGLPLVDMENAVDMETAANYTFVVSSDHLNYQYPDINIPDFDL